MDYYLQFCGPKAISMVVGPKVRLRGDNRSLGRFWPVSWTITQFWGPEVISTIDESQGAFTCRSSTLTILVDSGPFRALLLTIWVLERFPQLTILGVCLRVRRQHSQFWSILSRFVDYYSLLWGPKAISLVVEPQGAVTCRPSTIAVLADSGPFLGLLLSDLGSQSDFHDLRTLGCVYLSFINNPRFVQFRALSRTSTHRFKVPN